MKKLRLIYNPFSGDRSFGSRLDRCIEILQGYGYEVCPLRMGDSTSLKNAFTDDFDAFAVSGGDGTVNIVLNIIMNKGLNHIPLAIFPSGTANDFAGFLGLSKNIEDTCKIIGEGKTIELDVGKAGEKYFINVCAGGLFSDISSVVDNNVKAVIGKLAYYLEGIKQMVDFKPLKLSITRSNGTEYIEDVCLFLSLNTSGTGGIKNLTPEADIQDGLLDFLFVRNCAVSEIIDVLVNHLSGNITKSKNVLYFKDSSIQLKTRDEQNAVTDVDGEIGDKLPMTIKNIPKAIQLFIREENKNEF